ncbi:MAG: FAD-dependent oxidoreductase [Spirochaetales bacterium]|nr:FAD-dependent oxidoreductase [Spirochaetales bacterium]
MIYDVVVIGGGPAGLSVAMTLKTKYKMKSILLIKEEEKGLVPCGMPYIFGKLNYNVDNDVKSHKPFLDAGGELLLDKVTLLNRDEKSIRTVSNKIISYNKLVLATGSDPLIPTFIKGYDNPNIYYIKKSYNYMKEIAPKIKESKSVAIIGGGFIGLEVADELASDKEKEVTLVEMQENVLSLAFSKTFSEKAESVLQKHCVNILTSTGLLEVEQVEDNQVKLHFSNNSSIIVDSVIFALGYRANTQFAKDAGLSVNKFGALNVDNFMRTQDSDIVAIGDCAKKRDFFTRKDSNAMLASVAGAESRFVAENLFTITGIKNSIGTIRVFSTVLNGLVLGVAGITEKEAASENMNVVIGKFSGLDKHPEKLPDANRVDIHLTVMKETGAIIGAEISGGQTVGEMINVMAVAIQSRLTIHELYTYQIGTQPLLTAGPTVTPIMKAIENTIRIIAENV